MNEAVSELTLNPADFAWTLTVRLGDKALSHTFLNWDFESPTPDDVASMRDTLLTELQGGTPRQCDDDICESCQ